MRYEVKESPDGEAFPWSVIHRGSPTQWPPAVPVARFSHANDAQAFADMKNAEVPRWKFHTMYEKRNISVFRGNSIVYTGLQDKFDQMTDKQMQAIADFLNEHHPPEDLKGKYKDVPASSDDFAREKEVHR